MRAGLLSSEIFDTLAEARYLIDRWRLFYNHRRIQRALCKLAPAAFAAACAAVPLTGLSFAGSSAYDVWAVNEDAEYHEAGSAGVTTIAENGSSGLRAVPKRVSAASAS